MKARAETSRPSGPSTFPPFSGFQNSSEGTAIPNVFFARVLPQIDDPAELVVTLYAFFAQALHSRRPRFVTLRELESDETLARSLENLGGENRDALKRGLAAAVRRGTLARATIRGETVGEQHMAAPETGKTREEVYVVNAPANRKALEPLLERGAEIGEPLPPAPSNEARNIFALYEENLGMITPLLIDELQEAEKRYPQEWVVAAFREAVELNKRNWRYIQRILERWETEGPPNEKPERDPEAEWLARRYREGKQRSP